MTAINQEIAQYQQRNPEAGKLATEAQSIMRNDTMTPKEKMGKLHELRNSNTDASVKTALHDFEEKVKSIIHGTANQ
ncbi:unnamed protein product, partial [Mesorhabditis belari]|uniref:Uncharacterized protein n=1 Tax=Mesorhabditis belari TaxID=2138241 RepID=A0AAF3F9X3_9BILA